MIQPLSCCGSGFYCYNPLSISLLLPQSCHSLHARNFSFPANEGRVNKSECQPGLSDALFDRELILWGACQTKHPAGVSPAEICSPPFTGPPPHTPDVCRSRASEAHLITSFLISMLALVPSFKCSKVILKNTSFCFHFALAWPSHKSGLRQDLKGLG